MKQKKLWDEQPEPPKKLSISEWAKELKEAMERATVNKQIEEKKVVSYLKGPDSWIRITSYYETKTI